MTRQEVIDKAIDLVGPILGAGRGKQLIEAIVGIDRLDQALALRPLLQSRA